MISQLYRRMRPSYVLLGMLLVHVQPGDLTQVFWNAPSEKCLPHGVAFNLSEFNIIQNAGDRFLGTSFNTLYRPGLWPQSYDNGTEINGGIPQRADLQLHLEQLRRDVRRLIPRGFSGPAVIDFEQWLTTLRSSGIERYRRIARAHFQEGRQRAANALYDSDGGDDADTADAQFERAARLFLEQSLLVARAERPEAQWGYYHYPYCKNYLPHVDRCAAPIREDNDRAQWLYNASTALFPSIYLRRDWSSWTHTVQVRVVLDEAERVAAAAGGRPIFAFTWYNYHRAGVTEYVSPADLLATIGQAIIRGVEGVAIWGGTASMDTPQLCVQLHDFVRGRLGPFVRYMTSLPAGRLRHLSAALAAGPGSFYSQVARLQREGAFGWWTPPSRSPLGRKAADEVPAIGGTWLTDGDPQLIMPEPDAPIDPSDRDALIDIADQLIM